jgi:Ca2+:H+ antiporter
MIRSVSETSHTTSDAALPHFSSVVAGPCAIFATLVKKFAAVESTVGCCGTAHCSLVSGTRPKARKKVAQPPLELIVYILIARTAPGELHFTATTVRVGAVVAGVPNPSRNGNVQPAHLIRYFTCFTREDPAPVGKVAYAVTVLLTAGVVAAELLHAPILLVFAVSALALVGLAWVLGQATESLGHHAGPRVGGILNATFGNAAELIITIFALAAGLTTVVKASIIGSIIGNVLLVLGASLLLGGLKNGAQTFSATIAGINASMLAIVAAALSLPTIFAATNPGQGPATLSVEVAVVMFVLYVLYLLFYLRSPEGGVATGEGHAPFGRTTSLVVLLASTAAVAFTSEAFVGAIEPLTEEYGISELFVGVIIVPIVGNIAEHVVGVQIAYKNNMDFSMAISLGSSIQVALLVTPILVFLGPLLGHPLRLVFTPLELGALAAAVVVTGFVALDGRSNWLEGAMLCGVYVIAALAFFFS